MLLLSFKCSSLSLFVDTFAFPRVTNFLLGFSEALQAARQRIPTPLPSRQRLQQQQQEEEVEEQAGEHLLQVKVSHHRLWRRSRKNLRHLKRRSPCQIIPRCTEIKRMKSFFLSHPSQTKHPVQLLNEMSGPLVYEQTGQTGVPPNCIFTMAVTVNGTTYSGQGKSKKEAKKAAAISAVAEIYSVHYPAA